MRTPLEIYDELRIYEGLRKHQLRVAAVARHVALRAPDQADADTVTRVGLFHDLGNIIKADLPLYKEFLVPEGLDYWEGVKREFFERFGTDEHVATQELARAIGLGERELELIENMRFVRTQWIVEEASLEQKICKYADMRVSPWGIVPMRERLAEARERYKGKPMDPGETYTPESLARSAALCDMLESQLVERLGLVPHDITDVSMASVVEELKRYPVV
jgi:hypothetical protein